ncbi:site-specific DNA-methyltransferase [Phocaeicola vulgatus]|uniref:site-specific DNA-methyltransferase n=1 Tax=Phocaeicola vulgatus TaxID=821 RepID=UPI000E444A00|nr:site-specific DNA-methyltransferase [Phocaeicola vulgatus]RGM83087.1 site-specific DNA-methyltransferase [Phocaeicola vulgatus]RGN02247.1 site-specific DNA-methyltransferase [Phocaeicola vulgatus]
MDKLKMQSPDAMVGNVAKIAALFPQCVTERMGKDGHPELAVDFDKLREELSADALEPGEERYQFTWPDKKASGRLANTPTTMTLRPCPEESVNFDTTQNLYIEGDNLEILKILREDYLGAVKMIYIDPPYNTGNDFVYNDDFAQGRDEYETESGAFDAEGNQMLDPMQRNTEANGRFHTDWLNMIYPRLKVARELLSDDGVIFISIDDNESENLRKVCDEVFGSCNYINTFAWVNNLTGRQISGKGAAKTWEPILAYAKDLNQLSTFDIDITFAKDKMPDSYKGFKKDLREDKFGSFAVGDTLYNHNRKFNEDTRPNLVFSIFFNPDTEEIKSGDIGSQYPGFIEILPHPNGDGVHKYHAWRWSRPKVDNESYNLIVLPTSKGDYEVYTRIREFNSTTLKDIITNISNGDSEVQKLFDNHKYFDYPKSVDLLRTLLGFSCSDSVVLDFFSGSATTAHAVMKLNAEDGGHRKFIMVQLPEVTDEKSEARKAGYANICEIGKERIRRAGKKVKEEAGLQDQDLDIGFRVLKLDSSNMEDVYYTPDDLTERDLFNSVDNVKSDRTPLDLLFQVLPELNIELSARIEEKEIHGKKVFMVNGDLLIATFDTDVNESTITEIAKLRPVYFVMRDASAENDNVLDNFEQIFKHYSPDTIRRIL